MFTIAYSLTEDSDIHYSVNRRSEDHETLVAELNGLPGSKYNISVFALVDGLPFIRAAARSITVSKMKGKQVDKEIFTKFKQCLFLLRCCRNEAIQFHL